MLGSLSVESILWLFINLFWTLLLYSLNSRFKDQKFFISNSISHLQILWSDVDLVVNFFVSESTGWKCRGNFILNYYWSIINIPIKNDGYVWNKFHLFVFFSFQVRNIQHFFQRERRTSGKTWISFCIAQIPRKTRKKYPIRSIMHAD